ncbi:hypothetical protein MW887_003544 [Aspergillus wentii]|nr:hypothetical protein MW887_003544 [Aspergillus wentii]
MASYSYQPLASPTNIRIIALDPSPNRDSPLRCRIEEISVNNLEETYEAISYTWGAPIFSQSIYSSENTVLRITPNLHAALTRFRSPHYVRRLWADSICINQGDDDEKTVQIQLMRQVFRNASRVLVWLGDRQDGEEAVKLLCKKTKGDDKSVESMAAFEIEKQGMRIQQLFEMPWFSRRWIIQEIVLNPDVVICCNRAEISLVRLFQGLNVLSGTALLSRVDSHVVESLVTIYELWKNWSMGDKKTAQQELISLLPKFHHFGCVDDRDRIYALSALANDIPTPEDNSIYADGVPDVFDYSASVEEVYTAFAATMLSSNPVKLLLYAEMHRHKDDSRTLPSTLEVKLNWGYYVAVEAVKPYELHEFNPKATWKWLFSFLTSTGGFSPYHADSLIQKKLLPLARDSTSSSVVAPSGSSVSKFLKDDHHYKSLHDLLVGKSIFLNGRQDENTMRLLVNHASVGIAPPKTQNGDVAFRIGNCSAIILRRAPSDNLPSPELAFQSVGVAMVKFARTGLMQSDAVKINII